MFPLSHIIKDSTKPSFLMFHKKVLGNKDFDTNFLCLLDRIAGTKSTGPLTQY